jgi:hypothetical protein
MAKIIRREWKSDGPTRELRHVAFMSDRTEWIRRCPMARK